VPDRPPDPVAADPLAPPPFHTLTFTFAEPEALRHATTAASALRSAGYKTSISSGGPVFDRGKQVLEATGTPVGDLTEAVELFERWAPSHGGELDDEDRPTTRTESVCFAAGYASCELAAYLTGVDLGDFGTRIAALSVGGAAGLWIGRRIQRRLDEQFRAQRPMGGTLPYL
jgi:hypothetical protein